MKVYLVTLVDNDCNYSSSSIYCYSCKSELKSALIDFFGNTLDIDKIISNLPVYIKDEEYLISIIETEQNKKISETTYCHNFKDKDEYVKSIDINILKSIIFFNDNSYLRNFLNDIKKYNQITELEKWIENNKSLFLDKIYLKDEVYRFFEANIDPIPFSMIEFISKKYQMQKFLKKLSPEQIPIFEKWISEHKDLYNKNEFKSVIDSFLGFD